MSETARALVQRLVEAGEWPDPTLLEEILAHGTDAVEPLLGVISSRPRGWPAEASLAHAIVLLAVLKSPEALQPLVDLLRHYADATTETIAGNVAVYGSEAIEPALAVVRDAGLNWYARSSAAELAIRAAGEDPALRSRVADALRAVLAEQLARATQYTNEDRDAEAAVPAGADEDEENAPAGSAEDYYQMNSCLVAQLALLLADTKARGLIRAAYRAGIVDPWVIGGEDVEGGYARGGQTLDAPRPREDLARYRVDYDNHRAERHRKPLELRVTPP